jgi:ubiquinone/menaquinone biosynthesis C-methylase UbiE
MILELLFAILLQTPRQHEHPPKSAGDYARHLEDPSRDDWQKPHEVVTALAIRADEMIADIGSGSGYFTRRFARHAATVYAVDVNPELLDRAKKDAPKNVQVILAKPDDPKLPPASVDTIFFCNVLHHVENRAAYYKRLTAALKPGGRIVIIDFHKRELPVGPPVGMKLSAEEVEEELAAAGFAKTRNLEFLPHQYFLIFERTP